MTVELASGPSDTVTMSRSDAEELAAFRAKARRNARRRQLRADQPASFSVAPTVARMLPRLGREIALGVVTPDQAAALIAQVEREVMTATLQAMADDGMSLRQQAAILGMTAEGVRNRADRLGVKRHRQVGGQPSALR